ncbi:MAG: MCE family protein [Candidatus Omnitrophica bacterium]|nr:MCE family protein [Candidatus Omnitrophota bacterium]
MKKENLELRVGVFVFIALATLAMMVYKTGDFYLKPGYQVRFLFAYISGIESGSPVRLAGVPVGEVTAIHAVRSAEGATQVEVEARIDRGAMIEEDAEVKINSLGLLGEKYIEILPGSSGNKVLSEGSTIVGQVPVGMEQVTQSGQRLIQKLENTADSINRVVGDPEFQASAKGTFVNAEKVSANLYQASDDLKEAAKSARIILAKVKDGQGTLGRLFMDDTIAKDFEAFVKDVKAHPWKLFKRD